MVVNFNTCPSANAIFQHNLGSFSFVGMVKIPTYYTCIHKHFSPPKKLKKLFKVPSLVLYKFKTIFFMCQVFLARKRFYDGVFGIDVLGCFISNIF